MSDFIISEPLLVSLDDYVPEGGGATGDSFYLKTDPTVLLKLFHEGKTQQSMDELRLSHLVYNTGIPTPGLCLTIRKRYSSMPRNSQGCASACIRSTWIPRNSRT